MPAIHRNGDSRSCGAKTLAVGQGTVFVNNQLASTLNDPDSHGGGNLLASNSKGSVFIAGKPIGLDGSAAMPEALCNNGNGHCRPKAAGGSPDVNAV